MPQSDIIAAIMKYAVKNAMDYGKASESAVCNKVISQYPELRKDIKSLSNEVREVVLKVNLMSKDSLETEYSKYSNEFRTEAKIKLEKTSKPNMNLEGAVQGNFKTRFPPEPNGFMHIGHAKAAFLESEFSRIYKGSLVLYFDDTNPDSEKQEFVDAIKKDLDWLGIRFSEEYYASDHIEQMYKYADMMISKGNAYVCMCSAEEAGLGREKGEICRHKKQTSNQNSELWKRMLIGEFAENEATLRLNGDMQSLNTTMRDPILFRIKSSTHYRQGDKYRVWPTYNFNTPVMDSIKGITDVIRSKEYELRDELFNCILNSLSLRKPIIHSMARLEISNNLTSKRKLNELIRQGKIGGYDDPRLVTIAGLRRRGITPDAIREFVLRFGMSKNESSVDINMLLSYNRKEIDQKAKRLFALKDPIEIDVENLGIDKVILKNHPSQNLGQRSYKMGKKFFIERDDATKFREGSIIRLKDAFSVVIKNTGNVIKAEYSEEKSESAIQWIAENNLIKCRIASIGNLMDGELFNEKSLVVNDAYVEKHATRLSEGSIVQFERIGFFKLDKKDEMYFISL